MTVRKTGLANIPEGSTAQILATLKDEAGVVIPSASLFTLTLTLYPLGFPTTFINSRSAQDILGVNGGTVHATSGLLTLVLAAADNAISDDGNDTEDHIALIKWTWSAGAKKGRKEILLTVDNLDAEP